jgi:hypothetical protein
MLLKSIFFCNQKVIKKLLKKIFNYVISLVQTMSKSKCKDLPARILREILNGDK